MNKLYHKQESENCSTVGAVCGCAIVVVVALMICVPAFMVGRPSSSINYAQQDSYVLSKLAGNSR